MTDLRVRLELVKLAHELDVAVEDVQFLDVLSPDQLRDLRARVTGAIYAPHEHRFRRMASFGKLVPVPVAAKGTQVALGPLVAARVAAAADVDLAVRLSSHISPAFLSRMTPYLDPTRVAGIVSQLDEDLVVEVGHLTVARQEYIPLARFISYVPVATALRVVAEAPPLDLLRTALYAEDLDALDALIAAVPEDRLADVLVAADGADELDDALTLLELISVESRVRVVRIAQGLDEGVRDSLIRTVHANDAWWSLRPVLENLTADEVHQLLDVPAIREPGVRERLAEVVAGDPAAQRVFDDVAAAARSLSLSDRRACSRTAASAVRPSHSASSSPCPAPCESGGAAASTAASSWVRSGSRKGHTATPATWRTRSAARRHRSAQSASPRRRQSAAKASRQFATPSSSCTSRWVYAARHSIRAASASSPATSASAASWSRTTARMWSSSIASAASKARSCDARATSRRPASSCRPPSGVSASACPHWSPRFSNSRTDSSSSASGPGSPSGAATSAALKSASASNRSSSRACASDISWSTRGRASSSSPVAIRIVPRHHSSTPGELGRQARGRRQPGDALRAPQHLHEQPAAPPVPGERRRDPDRELGVVGLDRVVEDGPHRVDLGVEPGPPGARLPRSQPALGVLGEPHDVRRQPGHGVGVVPRSLPLLLQERAHRPQHPEPGLAGALEVDADQAVVDQPAQPVEHPGAGDRLGRGQGPGGDQHRQATREALVVGAQQPVAPGDRGAQRALAVGHVHVAGGQVELLTRRGQQRVHGQQPQARGRELDRQRDALEPAQQSGDGRGVGTVDLEVGPDQPRPLREQRASVPDRQRVDAAPAAPRAAGGPSGWSPAPAARGRCSAARRPAALPPSRCSRLSSTMSTRCPRSWSASTSSAGRGDGCTRSAVATAVITPSGSRTGARSTKQTASIVGFRASATASARRVLPIPPGPSRVTSRRSPGGQQPDEAVAIGCAPDQRARRLRQRLGVQGHVGRDAPPARGSAP